MRRIAFFSGWGNRKMRLAGMFIVAGLFCYCWGGSAAAFGIPTVLLGALLVLFWRGPVAIRFANKANPLPASSVTPGPQWLSLAQKQVEESIATLQVSALGSAFRKQQWELTQPQVDAIIDSCIALVRLRLDAVTIAVFFPAADDGYKMQRYWSSSGNVYPEAIIQPGLGVLGGLFKNGLKPLNLREILSESTTLYYYVKDTGIRSLIASPIVAGNEPRGIFLADSTTTNAFSDEHLTFLSTVASILGQAVFNAYLRTEHAIEHQRLAAVSTIEKLFFERLTIDHILDIMAEIIPFALPCDRMTISMRAGDGDNAVIMRAHGTDTDGLAGHQFSLTGKTLASILYSKNICFSRNFAHDRYEIRYFEKEPRHKEFASFLAVPLGVDKCKGMVLIESLKRDAFSETLRGLLLHIATSAGLAVEKVLILDKANSQATHDGLTGLFNHRKFQQLLKDEITRSGRFNEPLALVLCDIDFFKKVNDTYGHPFGDTVLKEVANILESNIRQGIDTAARYGGEEFALILVKTDEKQAIETAERIRQAMAALLLKSPSGTDVHVTMSFGISLLGKPAKEQDDLVKKTDKALYRAKEQGRNRVEFY